MSASRASFPAEPGLQRWAAEAGTADGMPEADVRLGACSVVGRRRRPLPAASEASTNGAAPPTQVAEIEARSNSSPPNAAPSMMASWIAATIKPPPASGSSAMPWVS